VQITDKSYIIFYLPPPPPPPLNLIIIMEHQTRTTDRKRAAGCSCVDPLANEPEHLSSCSALPALAIVTEVSITKKQKTGSPLDTVLLLNELGIQCLQAGRSFEAKALFRESLGCANEDGTLMDATAATAENPRMATQKSPGLAAHALGSAESEYEEGMHMYRTPLKFQDTSCNQLVVATLHYNVGLTLIQTKDFKGAKLSFLKALELMLAIAESQMNETPSSSTTCLSRMMIHHNLAYCYYRIGDREAAMHFYLQAMFQVKGDQQGKYDLAVACNCVAMLHLRERDCNSSDCLELLRTSLTHFCVSVGSPSMEVATLFFNVGQAHFYRTEYPQALVAFQEAYKIRKELLGGDDSIDVAICIFGIGQTFHKLGLLDDAMRFFDKFLEIRQTHEVFDHNDVITALNSIAILHRDKGELDKAFSVFERALTVGVAVFGGPHPNLASTLISFGSLCFQMSKFDTSLQLYEECLKAQQEGLGATHPETVNTLLSIAQIHWHVGRYRSAWNSFKEILTVQVQTVGPTSLPVASTVSSMALIYCQMEKYDDALELYQEALRIRRDCITDQDHPDITATLNTVGLVLCKLHEFKLAKEVFQECVRSRTQVLGPDHLDVAMLMHNLAAVHLDLSEEEDAIHLLEKTLKIRQEKLGKNHAEVASTLHHLGQAYQIRGTLDEAVTCFKEGLQIERRTGSKDKVVIRKLLNLIGNIHLMRAQVPEMMESFVEASRIEEAQQGDFRTALLVTGHNFFDLSRISPQCAPIA